jgi:hypothetical protein
MSIGYEAATATLELELTSGEIFQFFHVPLATYVALIHAGSKGEYYRHNIKPVYEHKKIKEGTTQNEN